MRLRRNKSHAGVAMIYFVIAMSVGFAIASFAIDFGRVQLAKTQLRAAANAAARFAVTGIFDNTHVAKAIDAANDNSVDGSPINISAADVVKGNFDTTTRTFTANGTPANAVQVTCSRLGDNGIPLVVGQSIGMPRLNVTATTVAISVPGPCGFTGLNSIATGHNTFIGDYDSSVTITPAHGDATGAASVGTNGAMTCGGCTLSGNLQLGPGGSSSGVTFSGGGAVQNSVTPMIAPADPAWSPTGNPGGIPQTYSVSGTTTLTAGTYYFTSLTISGNLSFNGATTIYVNGDVNLSGALIAYQGRPTNLRVYQLGSSRTFGNNGANGMSVCAVVTAPGADFAARNNLRFEGSGLFKSIDVKNNADIYYDTTLGMASGVPQISVVR